MVNLKEKLQKIITKLSESRMTISTMESCTGGALASLITDVSGASLVFKYGAVTYSNEYKIKMGVSSEVIDKYSVYSKETAREMAKAISIFTSSDYGIGITGKLGEVDPNNLSGDDNRVFVCIYDRNKDIYIDLDTYVNSKDRVDDKKEVLEFIVSKLDSYV